MSAAEAFDHLVKLLAAAFPAERDLRHLAGYANIDLGDVEMRGRARPSWEDTLIVATRGGQVDALRRYATERAAHPGLRDAFDRWAAVPREEQLRLVERLRLADAAHPAPPSALHTVRAPVADFTGRVKEVEKLVAELTRDGAVAAISGVRGMGGIGKTELALVVADRLKARYGDAQLMFELQPGGAALSAEAVLASVLRAFMPTARLPDELPALLGLYRSLGGRRVLLLLDNAARPEQVAPLLPPPEGWAVIVTTRERFALRGACFMDLELLPEADALALLRTLLDEGGRADLLEADLAPLAKICGYLPLALRVAASYLCVYLDESLPDYLAALSRDRLGRLVAPVAENVEAVLRTSVDRLAQDDAALAEKWHWLAVFPAPFDRAAVAAVWDVGEDEAAEGMRGLLARSLVSFDQVTRMYSLHDLLRDIAAVGGLPDAVRYRHAWHYFRVGSAAESQYKKGSENVLLGLQAFDTAWPHLKVAWGWMNNQTDDPSAQSWLSRLSGSMANTLALRLKPRAYIPILESGLTAASARKDLYRVGIHLGNLGIRYLEIGQSRRSIEYLERALQTHRAVGNRRGEGTALGNLGLAYVEVGELHRAITHFEQHLNIARKIGNRHGEADALGCLGIAYADLGEPDRAIDYFEQQLVITREIGDRHGEGAALGNLGLVYKNLDETRRAIEYYEQQLVITREIGDRRGEGAALRNMGIAYQELDETDRVRPLWEEALRIYEAIESPRAADVRAALAELDDQPPTPPTDHA